MKFQDFIFHIWLKTSVPLICIFSPVVFHFLQVPEFIQSLTFRGDPQTSAENPKHPRTPLQAFFCTSRLRSQLHVMLSFNAHVNPCKSNLQNTHYGTCQCFKRPSLILSSALCSSHPLCQDVPPLSSRKGTR